MFFHAFVVACDIFQNDFFTHKKIFQVHNQSATAWTHFVGSDLDLNCLQKLLSLQTTLDKLYGMLLVSNKQTDYNSCMLGNLLYTRGL